ncbi:hypothetical protein [Nocardia nova]|uniref:hypothetical protein n=1 Tax=Nocardia nova TaxID=37330 RepID=UPI001895C18F|nr:hypothetical protein [Nocardia nova]MBF6150289.1 hypothetical protein [Nocardia nova]
MEQITGSTPGNLVVEGNPAPGPVRGQWREEAAVAISWPAVVLGSVIVISGLGCYCMLVLNGIPSFVAVQGVLLIAGALVVLVLPASSLGAFARGALRVVAALAREAGAR